MSVHPADHAIEVLKYVAGAGVVAVVGWFSAGQVTTLRDVTGLQHDMVHEHEVTQTMASDISDIRRSMIEIARNLGTISGQEQVQASDLAEVKRALQGMAPKAPH
jgi:hypothetical protein